MFERSRKRIVAAIMSILVLLWVGTLSTIYLSSYFEMKQQNEQMLQMHAEAYGQPPAKDENQPPKKPHPDEGRGSKPGISEESPKFKLAKFYSVSVTHTGQILEVKNEPDTVHTNEELAQLATQIITAGKEKGTEKNLVYLLVDKGDYLLVVFMDNTVINESAAMLMRYTLFFGCIALLPLWLLSRSIARRIVSPLEESYQKQKQFISDAGHELKTPLAVVGTNTELLTRELGENQWLANIQYENQRMSLLVGQLLDLARTENAVSQTEHLDFSKLVAGESLPFESIAFEKGLELTTEITGGITVEGSSSQLKQLISILLDNAVQYSKPNSNVELRLIWEHGAAVLSVINAGEEIPEVQQNKLFERFYRVDTARTGDGNHYGLGLAIAKAIVSTHRGHINVHCHGGLVEFRVSIPALKQAN